MRQRSKTVTRLATVVIPVGVATSTHADDRKTKIYFSFPVSAASIQYLQGAELAVMQVNSNQQICAQFDFQNNLTLQVRPDGGRVSAKGSNLLFLVHGFVSAFTVIQQGYQLKNTDS